MERRRRIVHTLKEPKRYYTNKYNDNLKFQNYKKELLMIPALTITECNKEKSHFFLKNDEIPANNVHFTNNTSMTVGKNGSARSVTSQKMIRNTTAI